MQNIKYTALFDLVPIGVHPVIFHGKMNIDNCELEFDYREKVFKGSIMFALSNKDVSKAREMAVKIIEQKIIPILILVAGNGYKFDPDNIRFIIEEPGKKKTITSNVVRVKVIKPVVRNNMLFNQELIDTKKRISKLSARDRQWLFRAIRFWNRGMCENDSIDKFIDYYIAFEIIGKHLVSGDKWVSKLCQLYSIKCEYEGYKVNQVRAAILHGKAKNALTAEKAEKIARNHADEFGAEVLTLIKIFLNKLSKSAKAK